MKPYHWKLNKYHQVVIHYSNQSFACKKRILKIATAHLNKYTIELNEIFNLVAIQEYVGAYLL